MSATDVVLFDAVTGKRAGYFGPDLPEGASPLVLDGLARRRLVALGQPCPGDCGAVLRTPNRAERRAARRRQQPVRVEISHDDDCPAVAPEVERYAALRGWVL